MIFHLKRKGLSISRMTENLLYATSRASAQKNSHRQKCFLHFADGEILEYNYRLSIFEGKISGEGFFRVHRYYFLKLAICTGYACHLAKLSNNELISLNEYGYELVKNFIDNKIHP